MTSDHVCPPSRLFALMPGDAIISVSHVGKAYRIWESPAARLTAPLMETAARVLPGAGALKKRAATRYRDFWALKDISFEVGKGEAVGIIGRNGSGKSTLLQLIVGTLQATAGSVRVRGRVAALLELGSGFNPDFTGRENVHLNATVLGLSRAEIDARFDGIAAFADIGDFIDQPVKTYSSGMMVRLAFAVQTAVEPDILIIDEALGVGDFFFQQKCAARMRALRERGTTLLFVSHDMASVRDLCERTLYLRKGEAAFLGASQEAIARYLREDRGGAATTAAPAETAAATTVATAELARARAHALWQVESGPGDSPVELLAVEVLDEKEQPATKLRMGGTALIRGYFRARTDTQVHVALEFKNRHGQLVSSLGSRVAGLKPAGLRAGEIWRASWRVQLGVESGLYSFQFCLGQPHAQPNVGFRVAETPWLGPVSVAWDYDTEPAPFLGMFDLPATLNFERVGLPPVS